MNHNFCGIIAVLLLQFTVVARSQPQQQSSLNAEDAKRFNSTNLENARRTELISEVAENINKTKENEVLGGASVKSENEQLFKNRKEAIGNGAIQNPNTGSILPKTSAEPTVIFPAIESMDRLPLPMKPDSKDDIPGTLDLSFPPEDIFDKTVELSSIRKPGEPFDGMDQKEGKDGWERKWNAKGMDALNINDTIPSELFTTAASIYSAEHRADRPSDKTNERGDPSSIVRVPLMIDDQNFAPVMDVSDRLPDVDFDVKGEDIPESTVKSDSVEDNRMKHLKDVWKNIANLGLPLPLLPVDTRMINSGGDPPLVRESSQVSEMFGRPFMMNSKLMKFGDNMVVRLVSAVPLERTLQGALNILGTTFQDIRKQKTAMPDIPPESSSEQSRKSTDSDGNVKSITDESAQLGEERGENNSDGGPNIPVQTKHLTVKKQLRDNSDPYFRFENMFQRALRGFEGVKVSREMDNPTKDNVGVDDTADKSVSPLRSVELEREDSRAPLDSNNFSTASYGGKDGSNAATQITSESKENRNISA